MTTTKTYKPLGGIVPGSTRLAAYVSNKALTSNVATLTTNAAHGLAVGDIVEIAGVDSTFDGIRVVATVPTSTTFTYACTAANVASVAVSPVAPMARTHNLGGFAASNKLAVNGLATITVGTHTLVAGDWIYVNVGDSTLDGWRKVWAVPSNTLVCFKVSGATVATAACGGAVGKATSAWATLLGPVASGTTDVTSTIVICNAGEYAARPRLALSTTTTPTAAERLAFDKVLAPGETYFLTVGAVANSTIKYLMVGADQPDVTFNVVGASEIVVT